MILHGYSIRFQEFYTHSEEEMLFWTDPVVPEKTINKIHFIRKQIKEILGEKNS